MRLIKIEDHIKGVPEAWRRQYGSPRHSSADMIEKLKLLQALDNPTKEAVDGIIGNNTWTRLVCNVCGKDSDAIVAMDALASDEYGETYLCKNCLKEALSLFKKS